MKSLELDKYHGLGNDFLILRDLENQFSVDTELIKRACDRHKGIGADGFIIVSQPQSNQALVAMKLINADGSEAEMSGNGIRCLTHFVLMQGIVSSEQFKIETGAGLREVRIHNQDPMSPIMEVAVDMGIAEIGPDQPQPDTTRRARSIDMGNPHLVLFGPDPDIVDVETMGPQIEAVHKNGVNIEFVTVTDQGELKIRVWERGVGETMACGTGSAAAAVATRSWGLIQEQVLVHNPGGTLHVDLSNRKIILTGPTEYICKAELYIQ